MDGLAYTSPHVLQHYLLREACCGGAVLCVGEGYENAALGLPKGVAEVAGNDHGRVSAGAAQEATAAAIDRARTFRWTRFSAGNTLVKLQRVTHGRKHREWDQMLKSPVVRRTLIEEIEGPIDDAKESCVVTVGMGNRTGEAKPVAGAQRRIEVAGDGEAQRIDAGLVQPRDVAFRMFEGQKKAVHWLQNAAEALGPFANPPRGNGDQALFLG